MAKFWVRASLGWLVVMGVVSGAAVAAGRMLPRGDQLMYMVERFVPEGMGEDIFLLDVDRRLSAALIVGMPIISGPNQDAIWSPDGTQIAFTQSQALGTYSQVLIMDAEGKQVSTRTNPYANLGSLAWSPDGTRIAFKMSSTAPGIGVLDVATGTTTTVTLDTTIDGGPVWTPDGQWLVFLSFPEGVPRLFTLACTPDNCTGAAQPILPNLGAMDLPQWSQDGQQMAVVKLSLQGRQIYRLQLACDDLTKPNCVQAGSAMTEATYDDFSMENPVWSPDTQQLAFIFYTGNQYTIQVIDAVSGIQRSLDETNVYDTYLFWSPDGTHIAYVGLTPQHETAINTVNVATGEIRTLLQGHLFILQFTWRP